MTQLLRITAFGTLSVLIFAQAAEMKHIPSLQVTLQEVSGSVSPNIIVEASDTEGLDSLDINCPQADSTYHTQLSRSAMDRHFKRSFTMPELFPSLAGSKAAIRLEITVRNTRGASASATVQVPPTHPNKGN